MSTSKYILLLSFLLLIPSFVEAQTLKPVSKREAEQIGKRTYVISTGDTTLVVNTVGSGLSDRYSKFLFRKSKDAEVDSIFMDTQSDYHNLEEAALDVDRLLREIEMDQRQNNADNEALGFRLAKRNRDFKRKDKEARSTVDEMLSNEETSAQELAELYLRFGDKPTYYINNVEVPDWVVNMLYPSEVIKREMRVANTLSGNPNGEIWILVSEKALNRIHVSPNLNDNTADKALSTNSEEQKKRRAAAKLKSQPVVKRVITDDGKQVDSVVQPDNLDEPAEQENEYPEGTRVISRSVQKVNLEDNDN